MKDVVLLGACILTAAEAFRAASLRSWIFGILVNCARARAVLDGRSVPLSAMQGGQEDAEPSVSPDRFLEDDQRWAGHWAEGRA